MKASLSWRLDAVVNPHQALGEYSNLEMTSGLPFESFILLTTTGWSYACVLTIVWVGSGTRLRSRCQLTTATKSTLPYISPQPYSHSQFNHKYQLFLPLEVVSFLVLHFLSFVICFASAFLFCRLEEGTSCHLLICALLTYRVAQNKIPHQTICNISATSGLILRILEAA